MSYLETIQSFVDLIIAGLMALFFSAFLWGLVLYIVEGGDEEERHHGKKLMLGSTTLLLIMMVLWWALSAIHLTGPQFR